MLPEPQYHMPTGVLCGAKPDNLTVPLYSLLNSSDTDLEAGCSGSYGPTSTREILRTHTHAHTRNNVRCMKR